MSWSRLQLTCQFIVLIYPILAVTRKPNNQLSINILAKEKSKIRSQTARDGSLLPLEKVWTIAFVPMGRWNAFTGNLFHVKLDKTEALTRYFFYVMKWNFLTKTFHFISFHTWTEVGWRKQVSKIKLADDEVFGKSFSWNQFFFRFLFIELTFSVSNPFNSIYHSRVFFFF